MNAEYDKGYQSGYDAGYKRAMLDYGLEDDKPCEDVVDAISELIKHKQEMQNDFGWNTTLQKALDAAIEALKAQPCEDCVRISDIVKVLTNNRVHFGDMVKITSEFKSLPPVTPKPRTGHWVSKHIVDDCDGVITWYECSECGRRIDSPFTEEVTLKDYPYCHCGAKMEGVSE